MNKRTLTLVVLAVMEFVVVAMVIALFVMGRISDTTFWIVWIVLGLVSVPVIYYVVRDITAGIKSPWEQASEDANGINLEELILPRTKESTIVELLTLIVLIAAWWIVGAHHFMHDEAHVLIGATLSAIFLLGTAYYPANSSIFGKLHNLKQVNISARHKRVLAVVISIIGLLRVCTSIYTPVMDIVCVAVLVLTYVAFRYIQYKAK